MLQNRVSNVRAVYIFEDSVEPADIYNNLREWHLARLRNLAKEGAEQNSTTPASLIASDKEAIRQLIKAGSAKGITKSFKRFRLDYLLWFWLSSQLLALIMQMNGAHSTQQALGDYFTLTIGSFLPGSGTVDLNSFDNRFAFASFYFLPIILLCVAPTYSFRAFISRHIKKSAGSMGNIQEILSGRLS